MLFPLIPRTALWIEYLLSNTTAYLWREPFLYMMRHYPDNPIPAYRYLSRSRYVAWYVYDAVVKDAQLSQLQYDVQYVRLFT